MKKEGKIFIGTSGWMYKNWGPKFYPKKLPEREYLSFLAKTFRTVEVNASFYRLPTEKTFSNWRSETPKDFVFAVKMGRFITHIKRLANTEKELETFLSRTSFLKEKLGPILVQLPPNFKYNAPLIENFLKKLRSIENRAKVAVEFRNKSWFEEEALKKVSEIFKKYNAELTFADSQKYPFLDQEIITSDFVYLRFHGPKEFAASLYGLARLNKWVPRIKKWKKDGISVFVYFNNDVRGYALKDAKTLLRLTS